jgi:hypothetical protein
VLRRHLSASFLRPTLLEIERVSGGIRSSRSSWRARSSCSGASAVVEPLPVPDNLRGLVAARPTA